jgi:hypothetical protein
MNQQINDERHPFHAGKLGHGERDPLAARSG